MQPHFSSNFSSSDQIINCVFKRSHELHCSINKNYLRDLKKPRKRLFHVDVGSQVIICFLSDLFLFHFHFHYKIRGFRLALMVSHLSQMKFVQQLRILTVIVLINSMLTENLTLLDIIKTSNTLTQSSADKPR